MSEKNSGAVIARPPIGAKRLVACRPDGEKFPIGVNCKLTIDHLVTGVCVEHQTFAAGRRPFDGAPATLGRPQHQRVLGVDIGFDAKAADDIGRKNAHLRFRNAKDSG